MLKLFLIIIILFVVSGFLRRIIFSSAYNAFNKAAQDFNKNKTQQNKPKRFWDNNNSALKNNSDNDGEFVDYEEIK